MEHQEPIDRPDEKLLSQDVDGATARPALSIKGAPRTGGARIGKNFKKVAFVVIGMIAGGIVIGVMTAGQQKANKAGDETDTASQGVGQVKPPIEQMQKAAANSAATTGTGTTNAPTASTSAASASNPFTAKSQAGANLQAGRGQPLSPDQEYRKWLVEQRYKDREGQILAAQSATLAKISPAESLMSGGQQPISKETPSSQPALSKEPAKNLQAPQTAQAQNQAFLDAQNKDDNGYLASAVQPAINNHELFAGSVIPATLLSGINSDLPGAISAEVRQTVYDSLNPDIVLIPQGTRIVGLYSSGVAYGQQRVLVAWNQLIYPNGAMINLKGMGGTDEQGQAGFHDQVDNHYMRIFGSAILMSLLGAGAELSQPQNSSALTTPTAMQMGTAAMAQQLNTVGTNLLNKNLNIQPTLNIRPGYAFDVFVNHTMILPPYRVNQ
ncbi:TraB/TrbI/VirB10 family type IV secretion system protein [Ferrovum myxofaciens]|uniref:TrbI/VirB10 family protein n=1 Tax=Ferrovum myxofaciens TaxID=416213 RepID=UPI00068B373D|nr:TrbI/VirB10 family protein [Ferrovum myxofaciens]